MKARWNGDRELHLGLSGGGLIMTRLLPEHPQGSSRDSVEQLMSVCWVSLGLLRGCSSALLGPVA